MASQRLTTVWLSKFTAYKISSVRISKLSMSANIQIISSVKIFVPKFPRIYVKNNEFDHYVSIYKLWETYRYVKNIVVSRGIIRNCIWNLHWSDNKNNNIFLIFPENATSHLHLEPDWPTIILICDAIRQNDVTYVVQCAKFSMRKLLIILYFPDFLPISVPGMRWASSRRRCSLLIRTLLCTL